MIRYMTCKGHQAGEAGGRLYDSKTCSTQQPSAMGGGKVAHSMPDDSLNYLQ